MRKVKLIVHETYQGKRKSEDVFAEVFLSEEIKKNSGLLRISKDNYWKTCCDSISNIIISLLTKKSPKLF